jgi:hypothetical protein
VTSKRPYVLHAEACQAFAVLHQDSPDARVSRSFMRFLHSPFSLEPISSTTAVTVSPLAAALSLRRKTYLARSSF